MLFFRIEDTEGAGRANVSHDGVRLVPAVKFVYQSSPKKAAKFRDGDGNCLFDLSTIPFPKVSREIIE